MKLELDYQEYLDDWADHFGDETEGDFVWYRHRQKRTTSYCKMNKQEFDQCVARLNEYFAKLNILSKTKCFNTEYDELSSKCFFECELPLFC